MEDILGVHILAVGPSHRIRLPQPLCSQTSWIVGDKPIAASLLLESPARCRLLSAAEVERDPDMQTLKARIAEERAARSTGLLEFRDEISVALTLRLAPVQLRRHETSGWRFTLPRPVAAIMGVHPGEGDLAALFVQEHVEFWTMEALRRAATQPLTEFL